MKTPAQEAGIVFGKQYKVTNDEYNNGKIVVLNQDDGTVIPYFHEVINGREVTDERLCLHVTNDGLIPIDEDMDLSYNINVSSTGTVVKTSRKLTLDQIKAVMEIIGG